MNNLPQTPSAVTPESPAGELAGATCTVVAGCRAPAYRWACASPGAGARPLELLWRLACLEHSPRTPLCRAIVQSPHSGPIAPCRNAAADGDNVCRQHGDAGEVPGNLLLTWCTSCRHIAHQGRRCRGDACRCGNDAAPGLRARAPGGPRLNLAVLEVRDGGVLVSIDAHAVISARTAALRSQVYLTAAEEAACAEAFARASLAICPSAGLEVGEVSSEAGQIDASIVHQVIDALPPSAADVAGSLRVLLDAHLVPFARGEATMAHRRALAALAALAAHCAAA